MGLPLQVKILLVDKNRHSIRLSGYDYSTSGWYFVTICVQNRECLFGEIIDFVGADPRVRPEREMELNNIGAMIQKWVEKIPYKFGGVNLDESIVMPNHIHFIVVTKNHRIGQTHGSAPTLGKIVQWFKTMTTNEYLRNVKTIHWPMVDKRLWQRNYYEHIIRNENELNKIREYIRTNPLVWDKDVENPKNI